MEIAVGVLLGLAGLLVVGLVAASVAGRRRMPPTGAPTADVVDDLPGFLEFPPGSAPRAHPASDAVVALAPAPQPAATAPTSRHGPVPTAALVALAGLVLLLLIAAVVVVALAGPDRRSSGPMGRHSADRGHTSADPGAGDEARLRFGSVVLEEHAVGITVSYPELVLGTDADGPVVALELPTWNCLATEAPENPADGGCVPGRTEYAELRSPDLEVTRDGDDLGISGAFATSIRPTGSDPEPTGRSYELTVAVSPEGSAGPGRWVPASGDLEIGDHHAPVVEGEVRFDE